MFSKPLKNTEKYHWTQHAIYKLKQYGLSAQRVIRVIRSPKRKEEGIVPKTVAVMQPNKPEKHTSEIWVMYQIHPAKSPLMQGAASPQFNRVKIISAWRYPGVSPKRNPIPEEIISELEGIIED